MNNYGEIFCTAVNEIVKNQINSIQYDLTKDCTVISKKKKGEYEYVVSDGSSTFKAFATEGASYNVGDQVLVSIPQGDYSKQKTIVNKIVSDSSDPIGYKSPFELFVAGTPDLIKPQEKGPAGIVANGSTYDLPLAQYTDKNESTCAGFTRIAVAADFMTLLNGMDVTKGEYGLKLIIDDGVGHAADYMFSASEMLGNPYAFDTYFRQECVFTLPESILSIKSLTVYLYQDGEFASNGYKITSDENVKNIFVNNLEVRLGYEKGHVASELVRLSSSNTKYSFGDQERDCFLQWMHLNTDETFSPINNLTWNNYKDYCEIRWYQYTPGCAEQDTDKYGGENWKWLNVSDAPQLENPFQNTIVLSDNKEYEKVKVVVLYKSHPLNNNPNYEHIDHYTSNILEFTNTTESSAGGTQSDSQVAADLSLYFEDGSYGNYYRYDQNSQLIDASTEGPTKVRTVKLQAKNADLDGHWEHYNSIDWIRWEAPNGNSMVIPDKAGNTNFINPEDNLFKDQSFGGEGVTYSQTGDFTFKADFSVPKDNPKNIHYVKVVLSTLNNDNLWDAPNNRPITSHFIIVNDSVQTATASFKVSRTYSKLKLNLLAYDENRIEITSFDLESDIVVTNAELKNTSNFLTATVDKDNANMTYAIQSAWMRSRDNNNIRCIVSVNGVQHVITETLRFGLKGSNGTSITLILEMLNNKNSLKLNDSDGLSIQAMMVGNYGQPIDFDKDNNGKPKVEWRLLNNDKFYMAFVDNDGNLSQTDDNNNTSWNVSTSGSNIVTIKGTSNLGDTLPNDNYVILEVKYQPSTPDRSGYNPCLYRYIPIPMSGANCYGMQGADQILYNNQGVPKLSDNPYKAFYEEDGEQKEDNNWALTQPTKQSEDDIETKLNPNQASLAIEKEGEVIKGSVLHAAPLYSKRDNDTSIIQDKMCAFCENKWSQPILVMQSQYDYALLNSWNGKLAIDYEGGTILATMLGAGKKNSQNQFSGVLMGDIRGGTGNTEDSPSQTGVYGFRNNVMTYALQEDGTAFFGADKKGRIEFDGNESVIKSYGWTKNILNNKWELSKTETEEDQTGTLIDLNDAILLMQAKDGNYLKFNDGHLGLLEMSLSGLNITLSDKDSSASDYIDVSAQGIIAEVRRTANYYATCANTDSSYIEPSESNRNWQEVLSNRIKIATLDLNVGDSIDEKYGIQPTQVNQILKTGSTVAVKFKHSQQVKITVTETASAVTGTEQQVLQSRDIAREGHTLYLKLQASENNYTTEKPIFINNKITGPQSNGKPNNPFGWESGATIWLTYDESTSYDDANGNKLYGAWHVTDSGSYSNITQTADFIRHEVASEVGNAATSIQQTANSIRSEARRYSGYVGTCDTDNETNDLVKIVRITNLPTDDFSIQRVTDANGNETHPGLLQKGVGLAVTFTHGDRLNTVPNSMNPRELKIKCTVDKANPGANEMTREVIIAAEGNQFSWEPGSTVYFVYNGEKWVVSDAGSYSRITQTADSITSEVRRTAQYYGTCSDDDNKTLVTTAQSSYIVKTVQLSNAKKGKTETDIDPEAIRQKGVTIAVTFENPQTVNESIDESTNKIIRSGEALRLNVNGIGPLPIYINGKIVGKVDDEKNKITTYGWDGGSTIYFTYDTTGEGRWIVSDSGSYSKIKQTADMIQTEVADVKGNVSTLTQTATDITAEVRRTAKYYGKSSTPNNTGEKRVNLTNIESIDLTTIRQDGVTIAVNFEHGQSVTTKYRDIDREDIDYTEKEYYTTGIALSINFDGKTADPIYINNNRTEEAHPFGWEAGSTIYFTWDSGDNGHWNVSDSGAYSKIIQTADSITSKVETLDKQTKSMIQQTATSIKTEVAQQASRYFVCPTSNGTTTKELAINIDEGFIPFNNGCIISVYFDDAETNGAAQFKYGNNTYPINGKPTWEAKEILSFVFNNDGKFSMTSISKSTITQTANNIEAKVVSQEGGNDKGFSWNLTSNGFTLNSSINKTVFNCTHDGLILVPKTFSLDSGDWTSGKVILKTNPAQNDYYFGVGTNNEHIRFSHGQGLEISATSFNLNTDNFKINSNGSPYLQVTHNNTDVLQITTDSFQIQSLPGTRLEQQSVYYVISNYSSGSNIRKGNLNENKTKIGWVDMSDSGKVANYAKGSYIPVTTMNPYKYNSSELWYETIDGYFLCCRGSSNDSGNGTLFLSLAASGGTGSTNPKAFVAWSGKWDIESSNEKMIMDIQKGKIQIYSNNIVGTNCKDANGYTVEGGFKTTPELSAKALYIGMSPNSPLSIGNFYVDWSGQIGSGKWNITPNGGATFGWLWSSSINCNSLTCNGTSFSSIQTSINTLNTNVYNLNINKPSTADMNTAIGTAIDNNNNGYILSVITKFDNRMTALENRIIALENKH